MKMLIIMVIILVVLIVLYKMLVPKDKNLLEEPGPDTDDNTDQNNR